MVLLLKTADEITGKEISFSSLLGLKGSRLVIWHLLDSGFQRDLSGRHGDCCVFIIPPEGISV